MHLRPALAVPAVLAVLITGGLTATTATARPSDRPGDQPAKVSSSTAQARAALADARGVLSGTKRGDATMALRDLWLSRPALAGADRAAADRLLARPDDETPGSWQTQCTADNCYHWLTSGPDAATPDYVAQVIATVDGVHDTYVAAGYRAPKADGTAGGNAKTDIYLEDVHDDGLYGYCTSDAPNPPASGPYDEWAYCVLDNDFVGFPLSPLESLQVTAAHEYFHAVQFAYDFFEDRWLMEATATWAEDELFPDVNDNLQYLPESPLAKPTQPLDTFNDDGAQYGTWIFFRFLTEALSAEEGGMPTLVRDIWRRADSVNGSDRDEYSIQAVANTLRDYGYDFAGVYGLFAAANRAPALSYDEGAANHYPSVGPAAMIKLSSAKKDSGWQGAKLRHLSSITPRYVPGRGLGATSWKLKLSFDLPSRTTSPAAVVTVVRRSGAPQVTVVPLNAQGDATRTVPFGSRAVKYVEVTLANASTRYTCWTGGAYSCQGGSLDDRGQVAVRAKAVR